MSYVISNDYRKENSIPQIMIRYRNISFSDETPHEDFYKYLNVKDWASKCELYKEDIVRCRTVGIFFSDHGRFFLADMDDSGVQSEIKVQASLVYLKSPLPSTVIPYPVQVFGMLQWKNRPVIFIKVLQVLSVPVAIRYRDIMGTIAAQHLANHEDPPDESSSSMTS